MNYAVLTSGGDAPGMNYFIWLFSQKILASDKDELYIVKKGFKGLGEGNFTDIRKDKEMLTLLDKNKNNGGSCIYSARCDEWFDSKFRGKAISQMQDRNVDRLIVVGGNGSERGVADIMHNFPTFLVPATIDNDVKESTYALGVDSAVEAAGKYIDRIGIVQQSMERFGIYEMMGKHDPMLTLRTACKINADAIVINSLDENVNGRKFAENNLDLGRIVEVRPIAESLSKLKKDDSLKNELCNYIVSDKVADIILNSGKSPDELISVTVLENEPGANVKAIEGFLRAKNEANREDFPFECRSCIIGYEQRAGAPAERDRLFAEESADILLNNEEMSSGLLTCHNSDDNIDMAVIPDNTK